MYLTAVMRSWRAFSALSFLWIIVVNKTEPHPNINWTLYLINGLTSETDSKFERGLQVLKTNVSSCMKY